MQLHTILDEMILGGQVIETSSEQIMKSVEEIERFSSLPSLLHILFTLHSCTSRANMTVHYLTQTGETIEHNQFHTQVNYRAFYPLSFHSFPGHRAFRCEQN
jgi:hypothetical protein